MQASGYKKQSALRVDTLLVGVPFLRGLVADWVELVKVNVLARILYDYDVAFRQGWILSGNASPSIGNARHRDDY